MFLYLSFWELSCLPGLKMSSATQRNWEPTIRGRTDVLKVFKLMQIVGLQGFLLRGSFLPSSHPVSLSMSLPCLFLHWLQSIIPPFASWALLSSLPNPLVVRVCSWPFLRITWDPDIAPLTHSASPPSGTHTITFPLILLDIWTLLLFTQTPDLGLRVAFPTRSSTPLHCGF